MQIQNITNCFLWNCFSNIAGHYFFGAEYCIASGAFYYTLSNVRMFLLFIFSFDRFFMVFCPFSYPKHSLKVVVLLSVIAWSLSATTIGILSFLDCFGFSMETLLCVVDTSCHPVCRIVFYSYFIFATLPSIIGSVILFGALFVKGKCIRRRDETDGLPREILAKREWRAIKTLMIMFLGVVAVTIPPYILLYAASLMGPVVSAVTKVVASNAIVIVVLTDPIVLMRNADVDEAFKILRGSSVSCYRKYCQREPANPDGTGLAETAVTTVTPPE